MNDVERLKTVQEILGLVASLPSDGYGYWGADTEMEPAAIEAPALEALKRFEQKIRNGVVTEMLADDEDWFR
jgi:hypothetical protein